MTPDGPPPMIGSGPLMLTTYARRAEPGPSLVQGPTVLSHQVRRSEVDAFEPCYVDVVSWIDGERRLLLPTDAHHAPLSIRASPGAIEFRKAGAKDGASRRPDHRGRLRLARGTLAAAGLQSGMRVAIIRSGIGRWSVIDASRLAVRSSG